MNLTERLNAPQREAVLTTEGPVLMLAGAGSGKTRALTHRIAYLIGEKQVPPWNILAITFTNKAADEMRARVNDLVGFGAESVWVSTFHSMCVRILRRFADHIGFDNAFTIYDTDDSRTLMRQVIKTMDLDPKQYKEKGVLADISAAKNELITPEDYAREHSGDYRKMQIGSLYAEYQAQCRKNNAMDFDDLIFKTVELLSQDREVRDYYQERFRYIHVDEYQDTNTAQFRLIELLAGKYKNLCVVGDDDQSIYKFRGANIYNILNFEKEYPGAKVIRLEQNYRSTKTILEAANGVIRNNEGRKKKTLWTENEAGEKIRYREFDTAQAEAEAVARDLAKAVSEGTPKRECAVLYRTNAQSRALEEALVRADLPYRLVGGVNFYQRMEIKDILAYLKTIDNAQDDLAVQRIINVPKRGIGQTSINRLATFAAVNEMSFYDACRHAAYIPGMGKAAGKIESFVGEIEHFRKESTEESLSDLIRCVMEETGYEESLKAEDTVESESRLENLGELVSKAVDFEKKAGEESSLNAFLEQVALVADIDSVDQDEDRVLLMTLHSAKGLEFDHVVIAGMEEGLFPSYRSVTGDDPEELEEERRLCYVGITRARKDLLLTSAKSRLVNGETRYGRPSRFVEEIPAAKLDRTDSPRSEYNSYRERSGGFGSSYDSGSSYSSGRFGRRNYEDYGMEAHGSVAYYERASSRENRSGEGNAGPDARKKAERKKADDKMKALYQLGKDMKKAEGKEALSYQTGDRVRHIKYGAGTVTEIIEQPTDYQVTVEFDDAGVRKMYAAFAKLKKIEE